MKILIIEDEIMTATDLAATLQEIDPGIQITAIIHSVEESVRYFQSYYPQPDLIFSDIELGDGLSFTIFEKIECPAPVIFCTAWDKYTMQALNTVGIDYIMKPFNKSSISKALQKYSLLQKGVLRSSSAMLINLLQNQQPVAQSMIIHQADKIIPIAYNDIALFYKSGDLLKIYTFQQAIYYSQESLDQLEQRVGKLFFRANRQFLVHKAGIKYAEHYFDRKILLHMIIPIQEQVLINKAKAAAFMNWLAS
jgi:DNA-binding LytR/AlgR family response regulator